MDGKTQQSTAVNKGSYTSGIRSEGGTGPVKRFNNPKDAYNDSYNDVHAKLNGKSSWVTPDTTVDEYIHRYAPKEDNNNPESYAQHAIGYFNKLLGNNSINLNSELGDIKDLLISKGFDPEHEFTKMHLRMEDPSVLADLGKTVTTKPESKTPQVTAPKTQPQVNPNPTFTASPFAAPKVTETKPQPQQPVDNRFRVVPEVLPKIEQPKTIVKPKTKKSNNVLQSLEKDLQQLAPELAVAPIKLQQAIQNPTSASGKFLNWVYDAFGGDDEDVKNVFNYMEQGGTLSDVWIMAQNFTAKKLGSEYTDLIGDAGSLNTKDANTVITNWGNEGLSTPKESSVKRKYLVDEMKVSDQSAVNQTNWESKSYILNLNSKKNKFTVLDNIHSGSGVGNINTFYNNFSPIKGKVLYTAQNDITDGRRSMPVTKINEGDNWYKSFNYLMSLNNNKLEVVKGSDIKPGDNIVQTGFKIFSMDDLDIKDGNINTVYNNNIGALVPKFKKSPEQNSKDYNHSYSDSFIIGLTDKTKTPGYIPLENATQYGKSRGGSFVIFSEDLTQQYMVGGSFKNLYDFYQDLKKQNPSQSFKIFTSDTGTYSNSVFPKSGIIDGTTYRESNNRNTWGAVQHLILLD